MKKHIICKIILIIIAIVYIEHIEARAEITEPDFVFIRNLIDKYESAYSQKNIKGMVECCDENSQWFKGLEDSMRKEFNRYDYIRFKSSDKRLIRDPQGTSEDDLIAIRRALYVAYIDSESPKVGNKESMPASLNEYDAGYYLTRTPSDNAWKIKAFGQMVGDDQIAYLKGRDLVLHGKMQNAFMEYKKSISINSEYSPTYSGLSDLSFAMRNISDSVSYAEKAVALRPDIAYYHYSLGMVYLYAKNKEKAVKEFETTKSLDKDFPDIDFFINNADKIMAVSDAKLQTETINEDIAKVLAIEIEGGEDCAIIQDLNLSVNKPKNWQFIPRTDWHTFVAMSTVERPSLTDPMINVCVRPIINDEGGWEINFAMAGQLAIVFGNRAVVRLGKSEKVSVAGIQAHEDFFAYTVNNVSVIAIVTTFEKNKMAYTIVYTDKAKNMKIDIRPYKELVAGIKFIDPRKDISKEVVNNFIAAGKENR